MIDIHSHILPGIDDGAQTEADSLAMAKVAVEQGIHTIVATPHYNRSFKNDRNSILRYTSILNKFFEEEGVPLTVLAGQETELHGEMISKIKNGELLSVNDSKYLFVEFPSEHVPHFAKQILFDIQIAGFTPIIVHPERNQEIAEHPMKLYEFVQKGALTQITAGSVIGKFGKNVQKLTHQMIQANLAHFIASDAHNITTRGFWMQDAFDEVQEKYGQEVYYMFLENSQLLIEGMYVNRMEPSYIKRKRFLGLL